MSDTPSPAPGRSDGAAALARPARGRHDPAADVRAAIAERLAANHEALLAEIAALRNEVRTLRDAVHDLRSDVAALPTAVRLRVWGPSFPEPRS